MSKLCPIELPVKKEVYEIFQKAPIRWGIEDVNGKCLFCDIWIEEIADFIVQACNSYEKNQNIIEELKAACKSAIIELPNTDRG